MKRLLVLLALTTATFLVASAHPPKQIKLSLEHNVLTADILHPVGDPADHYISQIIVKIDGKVVNESDLKRQTDKNHELITLEIPTDGKEIEVTATCNKFGSKIQKLSIPK